MAEGQVSHRNARRLTAALAGKVIARVQEGPQVAAQRIAERLTGDTFVAATARGKHHLFEFASGRVLHSHLGMHGAWRLAPADRTPRGDLWLALWTDEHVVSQHHGPRLRLYEPGAPIPAVARVGPDVLDDAVDPAEVAAVAIARAAADRPVGDVLLDQRLLSGIGNIYRAETLFLCGIDPWRPAGGVTEDEARAIGSTAARLMAEGVGEPGPITTYRQGLPGSRERTWVYGRGGRPCRRCGAEVRSRGMGDANRTIFWCPRCQT